VFVLVLLRLSNKKNHILQTLKIVNIGILFRFELLFLPISGGCVLGFSYFIEKYKTAQHTEYNRLFPNVTIPPLIKSPLITLKWKN